MLLLKVIAITISILFNHMVLYNENRFWGQKIKTVTHSVDGYGEMRGSYFKQRSESRPNTFLWDKQPY